MQVIWKEKGNKSAVNVVVNPMEHWLLATKSADILRRTEMTDEVKAGNPRLSETEAWRQAIYYLGLRGDPLSHRELA